MKDVVVCLEHRFYAYEGALYTKLAFPYGYWRDYLSYFDEVTVAARVQHVNQLDEGMARVDGPAVGFFPLPYYVGPRQFFLSLPKLIFALWRLSRTRQYFLLRSGNSSSLLWFFLMVLRRPYLREYPGNIKEGILGFAGHAFHYRVLAVFLDGFSRLQGRFSRANSFVSQYCQDLYSSSRPGFVFSSFRASEILLKKTTFFARDDIIELVSVGRLESEKGHAVLLKALKGSGYLSKIRLHLIGDGGKRDELEAYAKACSLDVVFHGAITDRDRLFSIVKSADVFVIPSLTEGMPRALLEAMAIGLPCIGTKVGGIPEVLPPDCMCEPNNTNALSELIDTALASDLFRASSSKRNLKFIEDHFGDAALLKKKIAFWSKLYE